MPDVIQELFITPPLVVARLGGGSTPQDAFRWTQSPDPHSSGETVVLPDWSLAVEADGTVSPKMPSSLKFRDGALIRPVAPFLEVWARVGAQGSNTSTWTEVPVTPALLAAHDVPLDAVRFKVTAINGKASRRIGNSALRFGTFPPVVVSADNNTSVPLLGTSPPGAARPMIPPPRTIPLGFVQVIRSRPQPAAGTTPWAASVNVEVLRLRFTPARGHFYGPPDTANTLQTPRGRSVAPVEAARAFLDSGAGWAGVQFNPPDQPGDTYDGSGIGDDRSLGVVDDTCEARIEVSFSLPNDGSRVLAAASNVFVAPPDFAPDRRPFLSLADELNDRSADTVSRNDSVTGEDRDVWVEDLFERIYETASLLNVDLYRSARAASLTGTQLTTAIAGDAMPDPRRAMGGRDALRNQLYALSKPGAPNQLPLTEHARMRHRALANLQALRAFVRENPGRLRTLVRAPFDVRPNEGPNATTMAMPPFMRNSNAMPLTLAGWQYDLLMQWVVNVEATPGLAAVEEVAANAVAFSAPISESGITDPSIGLSVASARRREQVLAQSSAGGGLP